MLSDKLSPIYGYKMAFLPYIRLLHKKSPPQQTQYIGDTNQHFSQSGYDL